MDLYIEYASVGVDRSTVDSRIEALFEEYDGVECTGSGMCMVEPFYRDRGYDGIQKEDIAMTDTALAIIFRDSNINDWNTAWNEEEK